jgi:hypothetical protein
VRHRQKPQRFDVRMDKLAKIRTKRGNEIHTVKPVARLLVVT